MMDSRDCVVIDNGSGNTKAGFGYEAGPRCIFPSLVGRTREFKETTFIGDDAQQKREMLQLSNPIERGVITSWNDMEKIWDHIFSNELQIAPEDVSVLLTEAPLNARANRENMAQIMFETFNVPAMFVAMQAVLSLYAGGDLTGMVLDSGDGVTHAVPVYEGYIRPQHTISRLNVAGQDLTSYLGRILTKLGYNFKSADEKIIVGDMKKKLCYVAFDYDQELIVSRNTSALEKNYKLPDGRNVTLSNQRFRCPEALFQPGMLGLETDGIHKAVYNSIMMCDSDIRSQLYNNVVLCGGTMLLPGIEDRLDKEIRSITPRGYSVKVRSLSDRRNAAWVGGSILTSLSTFENLWTTKAQYEESGPGIIHRNCL